MIKRSVIKDYNLYDLALTLPTVSSDNVVFVKVKEDQENDITRKIKVKVRVKMIIKFSLDIIFKV